MIKELKQQSIVIAQASSSSSTSLPKETVEMIRLFCMGYNNLNYLQINNVDINDSKYLECLNFMKNNRLSNDIKLPSQFYNFIKKVNTKHQILVKENQIKLFYKQMNEIQNNNTKKSTESNSIKYQQLFLAIQHFKNEINQLNQELLKLL